MISKAALVGLLLSVPAAAQSLLVFEGSAPNQLDVRLVDEANLGAAGGLLLQGIEVMPIEITGRRASQELDPTVARIETRNGLPRVELPGIGRLFAYRRQGGAFWGFLLAPAAGGARVVVELPGNADRTTPFADRIAVANDGVHAILPEQTFDVLHICRLDGGSLGNGATERVVTLQEGVDNTGLMVGATAAFATADDRILRLPLAAGNPVDLTPTIVATRPRLKPELAMSGDGHKVVFLLGASNETLRLYLLDDVAPAPVLLPPPPGKYEEPGYLPEGEGHLRLLLNDDGSRLMFMGPERVGGGGDESYVLDTAGILPTLQVTDDGHFEPWVGIHILPAFRGTKLVVAIGDTDAMDWFQAELTPTGGTVVNVTATGSAAQPFPPGTLIPSKATAIDGSVLVTDQTTVATRTLRKLDLASATSQVVASDLPAEVQVGAALGAVPDLFVPGPGDRIVSGQTGTLIGAAPPGVRLAKPLTMALAGITAVEILPGFSVLAFYLQTGEVVFGPMVHDLRQLVLTPSGGLVVNAATEVLHLAIGQPTRSVQLANPGVRVFATGASN